MKVYILLLALLNAVWFQAALVSSQANASQTPVGTPVGPIQCPFATTQTGCVGANCPTNPICAPQVPCASYVNPAPIVQQPCVSCGYQPPIIQQPCMSCAQPPPVTWPPTPPPVTWPPTLPPTYPPTTPWTYPTQPPTTPWTYPTQPGTTPWTWPPTQPPVTWPPTVVCPPCTQHPCPPTSCGGSDKTIVIAGEPNNMETSITFTNTVNNENKIDVPTNINNVHSVTITVANDNKCETTNTENGQTTTTDCTPERIVVEPEPEPEYVIEPEPEPEPCCMVMAPRRCRTQSYRSQRYRSNWRCSHQSYNRCGSMCRNRRAVYLKPKRSSYRRPNLYMPPASSSIYHDTDYMEDESSTPDCSGCINGGFNCSKYCYHYDCDEESGSCAFYDQDEYCEKYGGDGCSKDDGYHPTSVLIQ